SPEKGHGNVDQRPKGDDPFAEEQEDDDDHQADGDQQRLLDFEDGPAHEGRAVVADLEEDIRRQILADRLEPAVDLVDNVDLVAAGLGDDADVDGGNIVFTGDPLLLFRAEFG